MPTAGALLRGAAGRQALKAKSKAAASAVTCAAPAVSSLNQGQAFSSQEEEQRERQPRGQVCDSKTIRVVEERPIEKEVVVRFIREGISVLHVIPAALIGPVSSAGAGSS